MREMLERIGRYEVLELLAGGGQGTVYRARDSEGGEVVALKVMHPGHTGEAQYLEALRREANLASRLEHPNVTRVLDYQVEGGTAYVVMEYVPDVLSAHISPDSPMSPERVIQIARGICSALSHAHSLDVVHRDIKPQNILLTDDGTVKVTDFGIARAMEASTMSRTGVMGTPFYMSPEQWAGGRVDGRADVYSLGILLYELLTGSPPFQGQGMGEMYRQHLEDAVPPFDPSLDIPQWLQTVVYHCLEKDSEDRFGSADEVLEALDREVPVRVVTALLPRRLPRRALVSAGVGGGIFAALSIVAAALGASGDGTSMLLALLVLVAGIAAIGATYGIGMWVRRRRRSKVWTSVALGLGMVAVVVGVLTFIDPTLTGLTGRVVPQVLGPEVVLEVVPDLGTTIEAPTGDVSVFIPAGAVTKPTRFYYAKIEEDTAPKLPDGYVKTDRVFDISILDEAGEKIEGPVTFDEPIEVKVGLIAQDVYLSGGDASLIVIQHYHEGEGWEELPTEVDFPRATATALVSRLSIFALTVKEPEVEPEPEPTPTPEPLFIPVPTITPLPLPTVALPAVVPLGRLLPTALPAPAGSDPPSTEVSTPDQVPPTIAFIPIPLPTVTPIPTATPAPVVDDHGDNAISATATELNPDFDFFPKSSVLQLLGELETPDDVDYFSFEAYGGEERFRFYPRFLPLATDLGGGIPQVALYGASWFSPLASIGSFEESLAYTPGSPGIIYLSVSNSKPGYTGKYRIVVERTSTSVRPNFAKPFGVWRPGTLRGIYRLS